MSYGITYNLSPMKYIKLFEDFERSAYTKISSKILNRGNEYLQEICPFLNLDLYEEVLVIPGGNFLYNEIEYDSIESLIEVAYETALNIWDYRKRKYTINNILIDIHETVDISSEELTKIPYRFCKVSGDFQCNNNKLITLEGAPHTIEGDFWCDDNQ